MTTLPALPACALEIDRHLDLAQSICALRGFKFACGFSSADEARYNALRDAAQAILDAEFDRVLVVLIKRARDLARDYEVPYRTEWQRTAIAEKYASTCLDIKARARDVELGKPREHSMADESLGGLW